ncbi:hypothetical protein [uncultured Aquimarina sp.]|uniref:hypothetical protein n=1 Tax=uncultured Aquimarina sp. TaxID=575652 RepID=UPI00262B35A9|nr:hypothetical protein [uncultured Aquimarina sp.]
MESQTAIQFFPMLSGGEFYPVMFSKILSAFYTSNQKYLTRGELQFKANLTVDEINYGLQFLISLGEISIEGKNVLSETYYSFNTEGHIKNFRNSISKSKDLLTTLERTVDRRDNSNQMLNDFIKDTVVFYSEVLDYIEIKIREHFNSKNA